MLTIVSKGQQEMDLLKGAPRTTPVSRLDQVATARRLQLR